MDVSGSLVEALNSVLGGIVVVLGIIASLLPLFLAIWLVVQVERISRDVARIRHDVEWLSSQTPGGPPPAPAVAPRSRRRGWLWAVVGLVGAFVVLVALTAFPVASTGLGSDSAGAPPFVEPGPSPEFAPEAVPRPPSPDRGAGR